MARVAVIGAGLAGLVAAAGLSADHDVVVLEKSRGYGGRLATRSAGARQFDHGAQFFTARTTAFKAFVEQLRATGVVAVWQGRFAEFEDTTLARSWDWNEAPPHYVAVPGMNALGKHLAEDLDVRLETEVGELQRAGSGWRLLDTTGAALGEFDWVVISAPAPQAATLLPVDSPLRTLASERQLSACYALMLGFANPLNWPWDAARIKGRDISWVSNDSGKPGRDTETCLLVHSTNAWAEAHLEAARSDVRAHLLAEASAVLGTDASRAEHVAVHRWRYANIARQQPAASQLDLQQKLAVCGDWLVHGRVEGAFISAQNLLSEFERAADG